MQNKIIRFFLMSFFLVSVSDTHANENEATGIADSFNYRVKIHPINDSSLQKIILTEDIYSYNKSTRLQDISVVDNLNNQLPFEIDLSIKKPEKRVKSVALYPLAEQRFLLENTDVLSFKYDQNNRLSQIESNLNNSNNSVNIKKDQVVGYLLDLGEKHYVRNSQLLFELSVASTTSFLRFDIDQSDDLKHWRSVSHGEVLAQLLDQEPSHQSDQQNISQHNKINLRNISSRYLRLKLLDEHPDFSINSVVQEYSESKISEPIWSDTKLAYYNQQENGYILDITQSITYSHIKIQLPKSPSLIKGKLYYRYNKINQWIKATDINFFHIQDNNKHIIKDLLAVNNLRAKQIMIVLDNADSHSNPESLSLNFAWNPQELIFFANGNPPYEIVVGSNKGHSASMKDPQFISLIKNQLSASIPFAKLGESRLEKIIVKKEDKPLPWSQMFLWGVLILGVVVLAFMAKSLMKQVEIEKIK